MARLAALALLLLGAALARAEGLVVEVIGLKHSTVDQVLPVLRPLVPAPGAVTGMNDQLVVRATPETLQSVRDVLERIDRAPRRLLISVRQERAENLDALGASLAGRVQAGDLTLSSGRAGSAGVAAGGERAGSRARVQVLGTESRDEGVVVQQVQALEGRSALIRVGQSVPVGERYVLAGPGGVTVADTVRYLDVSSGFYVLPRVSGDQVTLEISPHSARLSSAGGGVVDGQRADTVLSGRLGEWLVVASSANSDTARDVGVVYSTRRRGESNRLILVRVEEVP
jgi:type II secretory pathway component GspD/PulD (secretin)